MDGRIGIRGREVDQYLRPLIGITINKYKSMHGKARHGMADAWHGRCMGWFECVRVGRQVCVRHETLWQHESFPLAFSRNEEPGGGGGEHMPWWTSMEQTKINK